MPTATCYAAILPAELAGNKWAVSIMQIGDNNFRIGGKDRIYDVMVRKMDDDNFLVKVAHYGIGILPMAVIPYDLMKHCNVSDLYGGFTLAVALRHIFEIVGD